jgi:hypothetical protein
MHRGGGGFSHSKHRSGRFHGSRPNRGVMMAVADEVNRRDDEERKAKRRRRGKQYESVADLMRERRKR